MNYRILSMEQAEALYNWNNADAPKEVTRHLGALGMTISDLMDLSWPETFEAFVLQNKDKFEVYDLNYRTLGGVA